MAIQEPIVSGSELQAMLRAISRSASRAAERVDALRAGVACEPINLRMF